MQIFFALGGLLVLFISPLLTASIIPSVLVCILGLGLLLSDLCYNENETREPRYDDSRLYRRLVEDIS